MGLLSVLSYGIVKKKYAGMNFGIIFFLLSIFGACNLLFPMVGIVAERLVFTASLGIVIALAFLINGARDKSWGKGIILPSIVMLYLGVNTFLVIQRNPDWKNRITLFQKDTENNFPSAKSQAVYGQELQFLINQEWINPSGQDIDMFNSILKAQEAYQLSLKTYPNYPKTENNLAYLYSMYFQDHAKAIEITKKLLKQNPSYREARENQLSATLKVFTTWCKLPHDLNDLRWKADQEPITTNQAEFSLIQQFEERGKAVLSKGMNPKAIEDLVSFAQGIEMINPTLANLKPPFSETVNKQLNLLYSGARPSYNILDTFRIALAENFSHPLSNREFQETKNKLRDICILEARTFDQMHHGTWALDLVDKYFIEAQDYEGIIAIHKEQIKNGRGSSKDYIQIGNAYLNLGDKEKSKKALKLGLEGLKNSKESSAKKEIEALNKFIESIDKQ
jgi:tetratricopeptide (TPR) repeat protein